MMFITFEGIEGSGKSTQVGRLIPVLKARGYDCLSTREPGATRIGGKIRAILLDSDHDAITPTTELLLYQADRAQHISEVIRPALSTGKIVISDRFFDATIVYQGYARGFDLKQIRILQAIVVGDLTPDLTVVLDLPVEQGLRRAWKRIESRKESQREDRFEKESEAFHRKVRQGYLRLAEMEPERFRVIDASADPDRVHQVVTDVVLGSLDKWKRSREPIAHGHDANP
jgi:dTMP kinase